MDFNLYIKMSNIKLIPLSTDTIYDIKILKNIPERLPASIYSIRKSTKTVLITNNIGGQVAGEGSKAGLTAHEYILK